MVPAYGPNWRFKIGKWSPFLWHLAGIHDRLNPRFIAVAPWNRRRKPRRKPKQ